MDLVFFRFLSFKFETIIQPGNEKLVHHFLFYECDSRLETEYLQKNNTLPDPQSCFITNDMEAQTEITPLLQYCDKVSMAWAVGGDLTQDFPKHLGYPLGGEKNSFKYFILEMHYDNPELKDSKTNQHQLDHHYFH